MMFEVPRPRITLSRWWTAFVVLLGLQVCFAWQLYRHQDVERSPGVPPSRLQAMLVSLGESRTAAFALSLYLQSFDAQGGRVMRMRSLDHSSIRNWLASIATVDPQVVYPSFLAARIYADIADPVNARALLELVHEQFMRSPRSHWPWLAHAVHIAKHRLGDLRLAQGLARSLRERTTDEVAPRWARDLEVLLLADLDEVEAAKVLLGGLLASGQIVDHRELEAANAHLRRIEQRVKDKAGGSGQ